MSVVLDAPAAAASFVPASLSPPEAWSPIGSGQAVRVHLRPPADLNLVGQVPGALSLPRATGTRLTRNPRFVRELDAQQQQQGRAHGWRHHGLPWVQD